LEPKNIPKRRKAMVTKQVPKATKEKNEGTSGEKDVPKDDDANEFRNASGSLIVGRSFSCSKEGCCFKSK
jgi:hypothetical protein